MKKLLILGILFLTFSQCTKFGKNISVEGRLINPLTGEGLEGFEIYISRNKSTTIEGGGKKVKTSTTDADGHFQMDRLGVFETHVVNAGNVTNMYHLGWYNENGEKLSPSAKLTLKKVKQRVLIIMWCLMEK